MENRARTVDRRINELAAAHRGLVTYTGLLGIGIRVGEIRSRLVAGRLVAVFRGVYLVGAPLLDHDAFSWAGLLASGPEAVLSSRSAAERRGLLPERPGFLELSRAAGVDRARFKTRIPLTDGGTGLVRVRQAVRLAEDRETIDGWPMTSVARLLVDLAGGHAKFFPDAWREAEFLGLLDVEELDRVLSAGRLPGSALVRNKLADHVEIDVGLHGLDSLAELDAIKAVVAAGAPPPLVNHWVHAGGRSRRLDLFWVHAALAVEVDSWGRHKSRDSFEDDRIRDSDLLALGILTTRFTARRFTREPQWCAQRILEQIQLRTAARSGTERLAA